MTSILLSLSSAAVFVSGLIQSLCRMRAAMAVLRFATSVFIAALELAGKYVSTYVRPSNSPSVVSISEAPRFQRGRSSVTPLMVLVNWNRLSTKRFERYGAAWSVTWKVSHAFNVSSGVSAYSAARSRIAVFSSTMTLSRLAISEAVRNASQSMPGAKACRSATLIGLLILSRSRRSTCAQLALATAVSNAITASVDFAGLASPTIVNVRSMYARYASRCGLKVSFR